MDKKGFLYNVFFSKIEKVLILVKKSIYIAWYRHHFLIPPKVLFKYIISFLLTLYNLLVENFLKILDGLKISIFCLKPYVSSAIIRSVSGIYLTIKYLYGGQKLYGS